MYIGVDTHKKAHVLVAIDDQGQTGGTHTMANTPSGWAGALRWARDRDAACIWGIENSGSLGKGFAQFLLVHGEAAVHEIVPHRTAQYRKRGRSQDKTDHTDALAMARLLRAEAEDLPSVQPDDLSTELRLLSDHRDNLIAERTRLINQLHAQMLQIDPCYEEKSGTLTSVAGVRYCGDLEASHADGVLQTRLLIVHQLVGQILQLAEAIETIETALKPRVQESETPLVRLCGVGTIIAARLIGELGCSPRRAFGRCARCLGGDCAGGSLLGWETWASAESWREPAPEQSVPYDRAEPTALRAVSTNVLREEARGGEDGTGRVALSEAATGRCCLSSVVQRQC